MHAQAFSDYVVSAGEEGEWNGGDMEMGERAHDGSEVVDGELDGLYGNGHHHALLNAQEGLENILAKGAAKPVGQNAWPRLPTLPWEE